MNSVLSLLLLVSCSHAGQTGGRLILRAQVWAGPVGAALKALGPEWIADRGLRSLSALDGIRRAGSLEEKHNQLRLEFLARSLSRRDTPEGFEERLKQPYFLGEILKEAAEEAEAAALKVGRFYSRRLSHKLERGGDARADADMAQAFLEMVGPYVPDSLARDLELSVGKARDAQYRRMEAQAAAALTRGLREIGEGAGVEPPAELLAQLERESAGAPAESSKPEEPAYSPTELARDGLDMRFDGRRWVSGGQAFRFFETMERLMEARLAALDAAEPGPWSLELLDGLEKSLDRPDVRINLEREGGEPTRLRLKEKIERARVALAPRAERLMREWSRDAAATGAAPSLISYAPALRLGRRYNRIQNRTFDWGDHALEKLALERLWRGSPERGLPSWEALRHRTRQAERTLRRWGIGSIVAVVSSLVPFVVAKQAFPGTLFECISALAFFSAMFVMTWISLRATADRFVSEEMGIASVRFFQRVFGRSGS